MDEKLKIIIIPTATAIDLLYNSELILVTNMKYHLDIMNYLVLHPIRHVTIFIYSYIQNWEEKV